MKKLFFLLHVLVCHTALWAQYSDSIHHHLSVAATGIINKTNEGNSYVLNNGLRFNIRKKKLSLNSSNSWVYGKQQGNLTNNDFSSILDFNFNPNEDNFYYWGLGNYEKSYSLDINNRLQLGGGVAYSFVDKPEAYFNLSEGLLYEYSDIDLTDSTTRTYSTIRNSFRVRYKFVLKEIFVFDGTHFLQNSLKDGKDYIIKSSNSLSVKMNQWFSFTSSVTYNRLNITDRENLLFTFGINMERYF